MLKYEVLGGKKTDTAQDRGILTKAMNAYIMINVITFFVLMIVSLVFEDIAPEDLGYFFICTLLAIWWRYTFEKFVKEKEKEESN